MKWISVIFLSCLLVVSCKTQNYNKYKNQQIELRDSIYFLYTIKKLSKLNWYTFTDYSKMYEITNDKIKYYFPKVFYSPDKTKMIVWIGKRMPNAKSKKKYNDINLDKLCPNCKDTIVSITALIGYRTDLHQPWKIYPFNQKKVICFDNNEEALRVMEQYYYHKMSKHKMYHMQQSGSMKGRRLLEKYGYNLQDKDFWTKCWLWQKDTVGSYGLYPFQIYKYDCDKEDYDRMLKYDPYSHRRYPNNEQRPFKKQMKDCAKPFKIPKIDYPDEILDMYK